MTVTIEDAIDIITGVHDDWVKAVSQVAITRLNGMYIIRQGVFTHIDSNRHFLATWVEEMINGGEVVVSFPGGDPAFQEVRLKPVTVDQWVPVEGE